MAWTKLTSGTNNTVVNHATLTAASGSAVSIGDTVCVSTTVGQTAGAPASSVVTDSLGNTYVNKSRISDATNNQMLETWLCIVTVAGTPTVQMQYNPTPGTSIAGNGSLNVDPFTGSNAASTSDGANAQNQVSPGTGTDVLSSGTFTTTVNGDLLYGAAVDTSSGADPGTLGTGFTLGVLSGGVVLRSEYKTQVSAGSGTAVTFTAATGTDRFVAGGHAVKPIPGASPRLMGQVCT